MKLCAFKKVIIDRKDYLLNLYTNDIINFKRIVHMIWITWMKYNECKIEQKMTILEDGNIVINNNIYEIVYKLLFQRPRRVSEIFKEQYVSKYVN
tara:strand:- start:642 stop:926 length:285 start_codon:yes stop_codon:yes gene_type:complete